MHLKPDRLLLLQPRWMGDVLLCTPAIREARRNFPDARIDFVTEPAGAQVLRRNPYLDSVIVDERTLASRINLLRRVATTRYDAVVDFRSTNSTTQLVVASRAPIRVGIRGRGPRNLAYSRLVDRLPLTTYAARHKLDMLAGVGVPVQYITDLSLDLPIGEEARRWAESLWDHWRLKGHTVVAVTPVAREAFKQWGVDRWVAVGDSIAAGGARVLLTHGPGEREQARAVAEGMRRGAIWDYETKDVEELAAVLERCALWVGNDGGAKHVAVAAGVPTVSVSRWQIGAVWTDATSPVPHVFVDRPPPQGCDLRCTRCGHLGCLGAVSVSEVESKVRVALQATG